MSKPRFAPAVFMVAFCFAYACVFAMNWPLFSYYPLHGQFTWGHHVLQGVPAGDVTAAAAPVGPAMAWYGLMASAGIAAALVALIVPDRAIDRVLRNYLWLFPCAAMLTCVFLLRHFFA
jgi:hypothetical protein